MPVTPNAENTFTIVRRPLKESERKTLERLMTMQKDVQRGRTKLAERRSRENVVHGRGGRDWSGPKDRDQIGPRGDWSDVHHSRLPQHSPRPAQRRAIPRSRLSRFI